MVKCEGCQKQLTDEWRHADGTICVAGHDLRTRECAEGGGPVTPDVWYDVERVPLCIDCWTACDVVTDRDYW